MLGRQGDWAFVRNMTREERRARAKKASCRLQKRWRFGIIPKQQPPCQRALGRAGRDVYLRQIGGEIVNLYEVTLHDTESIYLLAPTKYRALELVGDYLADAGSPKLVVSGHIVVRQVDLSEEQILRPEKCRACPLNE